MTGHSTASAAVRSKGRPEWGRRGSREPLRRVQTTGLASKGDGPVRWRTCCLHPCSPNGAGDDEGHRVVPQEGEVEARGMPVVPGDVVERLPEPLEGLEEPIPPAPPRKRPAVSKEDASLALLRPAHVLQDPEREQLAQEHVRAALEVVDAAAAPGRGGRGLLEHAVDQVDLLGVAKDAQWVRRWVGRREVVAIGVLRMGEEGQALQLDSKHQHPELTSHIGSPCHLLSGAAPRHRTSPTALPAGTAPREIPQKTPH